MLSDFTVLEFQGRDRAVFLNNFCTNSIRDLKPGGTREIFVTDVKGHVIGHALVLATEETLLFVTVPGQAELLIKHFDRYIIREQVTIQNVTAEKTICSLSGSKLPDVSTLLDGQSTLVFEVDWLKQPNRLLIAPSRDLYRNSIHSYGKQRSPVQLRGLERVANRTRNAAFCG